MPTLTYTPFPFVYLSTGLNHQIPIVIKYVVLWPKYIRVPCTLYLWSVIRIAELSSPHIQEPTLLHWHPNLLTCLLQVIGKERKPSALFSTSKWKSIMCLVMSFVLRLLCSGELSLPYWSLQSRFSEDPKADQMLFYLLCWVLLNNLCLHTHTCDL